MDSQSLINSVKFLSSIDSIKDIIDQNSLCFIDELLINKNFFKKIEPYLNYLIQVPSGEQCKNLSTIEMILNQIVNHSSLPSKPKFISIGGGSLGDFVGFLSHIYKRGVPLILIPTTWLSSIDSAHGGKNALNFGGVKNLIGSYHFPEQIIICREILEELPCDLFFDSWSEALKIAMISSQDLYLKLINFYNKINTDNNIFSYWEILPALIKAKCDVVQQDPFETKNIRLILNLGHTLGHVIESQMNLSHGKSIGYGLRFSYEFSKKMNFLEKEFLLPGIPSFEELRHILLKMNHVEKWLVQDKKYSNHLSFVFIIKPGNVVTQKISLGELINYIEEIKNSNN